MVDGLTYHRERISTPDGDFLDLDWTSGTGSNLVIICHGLEGNTSKAYVKGMAKYFARNGWQVLAWNYRGCSDEINRKLRFYHSGATDDLETVINHVSANYNFSHIHLIGFSLGGNLLLKYLGEKGASIHPNIRSAVAFSVPVDLYGSCLQISRGFNYLYSLRFLAQLKRKVRRKSQKFPEDLNVTTLSKINNLIDFDDIYTAPLHGFDSALDYYSKCSANSFLTSIQTPTLLVNAKNDPFLSSSCYPEGNLKGHPFVEFQAPEKGGHCGFADQDFENGYWSEVLAWEFMNR